MIQTTEGFHLGGASTNKSANRLRHFRTQSQSSIMITKKRKKPLGRGLLA